MKIIPHFLVWTKNLNQRLPFLRKCSDKAQGAELKEFPPAASLESQI